MLDYVDDLIATVNDAETRWLKISETDAACTPEPGKWCAKQIVGHLIDSAANNHQRFVRARWQDDLIFDGYNQDEWVEAQQPVNTPWPLLLSLFASYNRYLAHVMRLVPDDVRLRVHTRHNLNLRAMKRVPAGEPTTLDYFMRDYVDHLKHHVRQVDAIHFPGN